MFAIYLRRSSLFLCISAALVHISLSELCYQHSCLSEGCMKNDIHVATGTVGNCTAGVNGCSVLLTSNGEIADCVSEDSQCNSMYVSNAGTSQTQICCKGDRCNDGSLPLSDPSKTQCYKIQCDYEGCVNQLLNKAVLCDLEPGADCSMTATSVTTPSGVIVAEVATCGEINGSRKCTPQSVQLNGTSMSVSCCDQDRCNNGTTVSTNDPSKTQCYNIQCDYEGCVNQLLNKAVLCDLEPGADCSMTAVSVTTPSEVTVVEVATCGEINGSRKCTPQSLQLNGTSSSVSCCDQDRCNNGTTVPTNDPSKTQCYKIQCGYVGCVNQLLNKAVLCDLEPGADCSMTQTIIATPSGDTVVEIATCGEVNGSRKCTPESLQVEGVSNLVSCCDQDLCNGGITVVPTDGDYCYSLSCFSDQDDCLQSQISQKKAAVCSKHPAFGCFVHTVKANGNVSVAAGCSSAEDECTPSYSSVEGQYAETKCCSTRLCNNGGEEGSSGQTNEGKCYSSMCTREDSNACLDEDIITSSGRCDRTTAGCIFTMSSAQGSSYKAVGCASADSPCEQDAFYQDSTSWGVNKCCFTDVCNFEPKIDRNKKQCYEIKCLGTNCRERAIEKKAYNLCDMTTTCEESIGNYTDTDRGLVLTGYISGCATSTCTVGTLVLPFNFTVSRCCKKSLCCEGSTCDCEGSTCGCRSLTGSIFLVSLISIVSVLMSQWGKN